jgi:hypothetical protein
LCVHWVQGEKTDGYFRNPVELKEFRLLENIIVEYSQGWRDINLFDVDSRYILVNECMGFQYESWLSSLPRNKTLCPPLALHEFLLTTGSFRS